MDDAAAPACAGAGTGQTIKVGVVEPGRQPEDAQQRGTAGDQPAPAMAISLKFENLLVPIEQRLRLKLDEARGETNHAPTVGAKLETAVRKELSGFLPSSFSVGHGFIYDAYGDVTKQTDLIITNPDNPLTYPEDQPGTYVIDGVSAAGEVKAVLTTGELDDCIAKGSQYKKLRMSFNQADRLVANMEHMLQTGCTPPFIVIAFENKVAPQTLLQRLSEAPLVPVPAGKEFDDGKGNDPQPPVDAVCLLGRSILWNARPADPSPLRPLLNGQPYYGWIGIDTKAPLAITLAWLHAMMPRIQRGASVFVPYLTPYPKQAAYMAGKASFEQPEVGEEQDTS